MNKFIKTFISLLMLSVLSHPAFAESIDSIIKKSPIDKTSTIAVSVKNIKTGKTVYEYNSHKLMNPASSLKLFTMKPAYDTLSPYYNYKTKIYKDSKNNLYIKLAGDPTLTTPNLKEALKKVKGPVRDVIIDPNATDYLEWGIGWMWDDDTNPYFPKYSQFTINENKIPLKIIPGVNGAAPEIKNRSGYQTILVNYLKNGNTNDIRFSRMPWKAGDVTLVEGTVKTETNFLLPVDSTERYFISCLNEALSGANIKPSGTVKTAPMPSNTIFVSEITSDTLDNLLAMTLKHSNNLNTELIFKTAGGKHTKSQGSTQNGLKMFNDFYSDIKSDKPIIVDASGTSRNDLLSADWMTSALNKISTQPNFENYEVLLPKPIEGTLSNRLLDISRFVRAKTGTLSGISSITGYVTAKSGNKYSFAIMIQNFNVPVKDIKGLEDKIINAIYSY